MVLLQSGSPAQVSRPLPEKGGAGGRDYALHRRKASPHAMNGSAASFIYLTAPKSFPKTFNKFPKRIN